MFRLSNFALKRFVSSSKDICRRSKLHRKRWTSCKCLFSPQSYTSIIHSPSRSLCQKSLNEFSLLSNDQKDVIAEQRIILLDLLEALVEFKSDKDDVSTVKAALEQLDQIFLICIVGEFNVGKSTFINALLGGKYVEEGPTPTTDDIWKIQYGKSVNERISADGIRTITCPAPFLRDCQLVDTPGTNVVIDGHRELTDEFIPKADLILFLTSADRPFTESETQFMKHIQTWSKKFVFVVNKTDIFRKSTDLEKVTKFVYSSAERLLGLTDPTIFSTSSLQTLDLKIGNRWTENKENDINNEFSKLENYLFKTLSKNDRIKLKLLNPLGVAAAVVKRHMHAVNLAKEVIETDVCACLL